MTSMMDQFVFVIGCMEAKLPFSYIGLPMDSSLFRYEGRKLILYNFRKKLSSWKLKLHSIDAHSMLLKPNLGSFGIYYMPLLWKPRIINKYIEKL